MRFALSKQSLESEGGCGEILTLQLEPGVLKVVRADLPARELGCWP